VRVRFQRKLPPRSPVQWAAAALGSALFWALLLTGALTPRTSLGLLFAGGWTLSLLPVHSSLRARAPRRRRASPSVPRGDDPDLPDPPQAAPAAPPQGP
jgi:hypothetical protein